tara:strand:+ start:1374 stop:1934 length:561 start_codon:yes stop_codon:yes gene_type:complete
MKKITPEKYSIELCIICMDEKNIAKAHNCNVCSKDAWKICDSCKNKTSICPVCRTSINPISSDNIVIEMPHLSRQLPEQGNANVIRTSSNCKEICQCFIFCIQRIALFFLMVYLGKFYIYAYCAGTCDTDNRYTDNPETGKVIDKCTCYDYVNIDNYWGRFDRIFVELLIGIGVNAVLFGCCVKQQ